MHLKKWFPADIGFAFALLLLLTLPFAFTDLDLTLSSWFYREGWYAGEFQPWAFLYRYGPLPGLLLTALALTAWIGGWSWPRLRRWQRPAAVIVMTLLLGPGLLVNVLGKGYWGRPRPRDVSAFGGTEAFRRVIQPGIPGRGKSFPSGHPSVGYLFCVFFFLDSSRRRRWIWLGTGLAFGTAMGVGRIAQGAHFASDVLWSGGLTYLSAAVASRLRPVSAGAVPAQGPGTPSSRAPKFLGPAALAVLLPALAAFFLLATPYYKEWEGRIEGAPDLTAVRLRLPAGSETLRIAHAAQQPAVIVHAGLQGFGFPKLRLNGRLTPQADGTTLTATLALDLRGLVTERRGEIRFSLRQDLALILDETGLNGDLRIGEQKIPGAYAGLRVKSHSGGILLQLAPGSRVDGPVYLTTQRGDVRVSLRELADPGKRLWEFGTDRGTMLVEAEQKAAPLRPLLARAWSRWGDVAFVGKISAACGLNLEWNEGDGRSGLQANGLWKQDGNHVTGPGDLTAPNFKFYLATSNGVVGMQLDQIGAAPVKADSAPIKEEPEWLRRELINLPAGPTPSVEGEKAENRE